MIHKKDPRKEIRWWCATCRTEHEPTAEHPICPLCRVTLHEPMPNDLYFDYRGWRFTAPFICMGCGIEVCYRQWAFSRSCGACDVSNSKTRRVMWECFSGPRRLIDPNDSLFISEEKFIDPADRDLYPVRYRPMLPPRPKPGIPPRIPPRRRGM